MLTLTGSLVILWIIDFMFYAQNNSVFKVQGPHNGTRTVDS